jgi:hypothetical protein
MNTKLNKARGALIGSALGDAIGLYTGKSQPTMNGPETICDVDRKNF